MGARGCHPDGLNATEFFFLFFGHNRDGCQLPLQEKHNRNSFLLKRTKELGKPVTGSKRKGHRISPATLVLPSLQENRVASKAKVRAVNAQKT